jgi:hypothetical protein
MIRLPGDMVCLTPEEAVLTHVPAVYELRGLIGRLTTDYDAVDPCGKAIDDYVYATLSRKVSLKEVRNFIDSEPIFSSFSEHEKAVFVRSGDITATLRTMLAREAGAKLKETIAKTVSSALGAVMSELKG